MSDRDGNREIYSMDGDGRNIKRLTTDLGIDASPAWSADGTRIVFVSSRDTRDDPAHGAFLAVYSMNADGTGVTRLTSPGAVDQDPDWSPDGRRIVFVSDREGANGVWVIDKDGTGATRLTTTDPRAVQSEAAPKWSPDGKQIAFVHAVPSTNRRGIFVMNADGSGLRHVTPGAYEAESPSWSADGRRIAYTQWDDPNKDCGWWFCEPFVAIVDLDGTGYSSGIQGSAEQPAWRPR